MRHSRINTLSTYKDWIAKAKYDLDSYTSTYSVYDLTNCLLTLNAIPEWISKSLDAPKELISIAKENIIIMEGNNNKFILDIAKLDKVDHQLRLVRMFCNHAKHNKSNKTKNKFNFVSINMCAEFPLIFPVKFDRMEVDGESFRVEPILSALVSYFEHNASISC